MRTRPSNASFLVAALLLVLLFSPSSTTAQNLNDSLWTDVDDSTFFDNGQRDIVPQHYRTLRLDKGSLEQLLANTPREDRTDLETSDSILTLPLPEGGLGRFQIVESPIMEPGLARQFPQIKTFRGQGIDDPYATLRFDVTPAGFHAMVLTPSGSFYMDPYSRSDTDHYISYLKRDATPPSKSFSCGVRSRDLAAGKHLAEVSKAVSGSTLRTYRLAVAATGEYTAFHGGTVAQGQAAIVTAMNRVNGIYEREVAIRMVLVANNNQVIYTNANTDPYSNGSGGTMLGQNQSNLDSVIGSSNYDIGHVFSTGGGGVATLRVPCVNGSKARGVTGQAAPTGDPFWVDFVAHEMGHQWGGNHTFNGNAGSCAGGNRNGSTAYEPGSGTTIQAYAGICGAQDLQPNSDDFFHGLSLDEIISYSTTGNGNNCDVASATGNNPPTVDAGAAYTIPLNTPFELCGSATDPNGDALTYGWEEFDLGPAGAPGSPSGNAPIFRAFSPSTSPCRTFPQLSDLINNTQTIGELLPTYARTMNFRLTARDNRSGGGGVNDDATTVTVSSVGGPFRVTAPNSAVTWPAGTSQTVTWDVAGTDLSPISCASVDLSLSTDGGVTFPLALATGVSNNGSRTITVPSASTTSARVQVRCSGNIFFDISNADFTIDSTSGAPPIVTITAPADGSSSEVGQAVTFTGSATDPEDGNLSSSLSWASSLDGNIGSGASFSTTALSLGSHTITSSVTDSDGLAGSDSIAITVTPVGGGNGPQTAVFDASLGAPSCAVVGSSCDSVALLDSRGSLSPAEPNQPNTITACADGTSGTYHSDESNDRIVVSTLDGADFVEGAIVQIDATVWAWTNPAEDSLDLYYAADANNPTWVFITTLSPAAAGGQTLSAQYTLPAGSLQAVRANFRYQGSASPCSTGNFDDHDDLVFAVGSDGGPECTVNADCDDGLFCNGAETCNAGSCQAATDPCTGGQTCNETTDVCESPGGCLHDVDFEAGAGGWTTGADSCATGSFVVGTPDATAWQVGGGNPGSAFYTQPNPGGIGSNDVDNGTCEALSPTVNASAESAVSVSLDYFHGQRDAGDDAGDGFTIEVLNNGTVVDTLVAIGDVTNNPAWTSVQTTVNNPGNIQLRVRATDAASGGDIVEGGIDNVQICPAAPATCTVDDDFENGTAGWVNDPASTCTTGDYVEGNPTNAANGFQVVGSNSGVTSLFTATNTAAGTNDVDGGNCILGSPTWAVAEPSTLSVWYWHGQRDIGDDNAGDFFLLEYSTNGGVSWTILASNGDTTSNPVWTNATASVPAGSNVQLRMQCSDGAGPGDIIECGLDDVSICTSN